MLSVDRYELLSIRVGGLAGLVNGFRSARCVGLAGVAAFGVPFQLVGFVCFFGYPGYPGYPGYLGFLGLFDFLDFAPCVGALRSRRSLGVCPCVGAAGGGA
ncbi:hypothetical protein OG530_13900 [Streptomyces decoyicus]|uniref:hypothetical protein n=1 Tax=Streptomyces decoyicus TaxID=249567 RepID=UPI002E182FC6